MVIGQELLSCHLTLAYIGPGAGFAFLGSFFILDLALLLSFVSIISLPFRFVFALFRRRRISGPGLVRRAVVVGMDGLDPARVRKLMAAGELPNFSRLAEQGTFSELETTCPPISPVAWSSFATGANPGKHGIFDFLNRDLRTYIPELSSCRIDRKGIQLLRRSTPFWKILGDHGIFSTILRVPVTFPPDRFRGLMLSAMCVPDLRGTQGTYTLYEENGVSRTRDGGMRIPVTFDSAGKCTTFLPGPPAGGWGDALQVRVRIKVDREKASAVVRLGAERVSLVQGEYSDWIPVGFRRGLRKAHGVCRLLLVSVKPTVRLYLTPINLDPEHPDLPISHPDYYAIYLAKLHGTFATLGLAEDTAALNDGVIDDAAFLRQAWDIQHTREDTFFDALKRTRSGVCAIVFDLPDRVQHMFYRYVREGLSSTGAEDPASVRAIDDVYSGMDSLLGRVMKELGPESALFVMSDHGFTDFSRAVNINVWLEQEGYLVRKANAAGAAYLADVDWEKTTAYSFGLSGIYLNLRGRESRGIVQPGSENEALKKEIIAKLSILRDPAGDKAAIRKIYESSKTYSGPYSEDGPDLIVGYESGYRVSWDSAKGSLGTDLFVDNNHCWSGDHCIDRDLVPGVLFSNRKMNLSGRRPAIIDIAPTILSLFGIATPDYMDGKALGVEKESAGN
ncbi:MAG: alkaline phosphatase family protein [bacterium]